MTAAGGPGSGTLTGPTGLPLLSQEDISWGWVFGVGEPGPVSAREASDPVVALESSIADALSREPCVVAFSGGRDSSLVLARAVHIAARHALPKPVALTIRYPGYDDAAENSWQKVVVDHLERRHGPVRWEIHEAHDEVDLVGPLAGPVIAAHGAPVWPPSLGNLLVMLARAAGGALLTGEFGDEILGLRRAGVLWGVFRRRGRGLNQSDRKALRHALTPRVLRGRSGDAAPEWLQPDARTRWASAIADEETSEPLRWDRGVRWTMARHATVIGRRTRDALAAAHGCTIIDPLADHGFVSAWSRSGGVQGPGGRTAAMRLLAGDVLPDAVLARTTKAVFNGPSFGPAFRAVLRSWDGRGVDDSLVDPHELRRHWNGPEISATSALLAQQAWLHSEGVLRS